MAEEEVAVQFDVKPTPPILTNPIALRLAKLLIREWHDEGPADTFEILARRGRQTLQEFNTCVVERLKRTEKHPNIESQNNAIAQELNAVKQHLLILMQHNYVRSYQLNHPILMQPMSDKGKKAEGSGAKRPAPEVGNPLTRKPIIAYEADLFAAITSISKPRVMSYVEEHYSPLQSSIITALVEQGRLRFDQVHQWVSRNDQLKQQDKAVHRVAAALVGLVKERLVERAPTCMQPAPLVTSAAPRKKKASAKMAEGKHRDQIESALYKDMKHQQRTRFLPTHQLLGLVIEQGGNVGEEEDEGEGEGGRPSKRARQEEATPTSSKRINDPDTMMLWRVNMDEFLVRFRHDILAHNAGRACKDNAHVAAAAYVAMVEARKHVEQFDTQDSQALPLQNILRTASAITTGTYMDVINNDEFDVGQSLAKLRENIQFDLLQWSTRGMSYQLNYKSAMDTIQRRYALCWLYAKYGENGKRVFKVLADDECVQMEQKTIAERAMIVEKDARELLYKLEAEGVVTSQELHRPNEMAPSRSFYTWHVKSGWPELKEACTLNILRGIANTLSIMQPENEDEDTTLLLERMQDARQYQQIKEAKRAALDRYKVKQCAFASALMRMERDLVLFLYPTT